ncbi:MAG: macrocin-O-methyltransferase [Lawsonibacter sp.]|nr:macrocin-O-methyltransferase [Lawsonibacter sp.]
MKKVWIFGAGRTGANICRQLAGEASVEGFLDNDASYWGTTKEGRPVLGNAEALRGQLYDEVIIASPTALPVIRQQLLDAGVDPLRINGSYVETQVNARINFLRDFAALGIEAPERCAVAEGGVFQGEFAKEINACFPGLTLHLFDTFEGFDQRDIDVELARRFSEEKARHFNITSQELVRAKLPHPERAVFHKGYFPETAQGVTEGSFLFVNLDFDLYNPTLEGLRFFYPRMVEHGVILVDDYFLPGYLGIPNAIRDFEQELGTPLVKLPIGDHCGIAIVKQG